MCPDKLVNYGIDLIFGSQYEILGIFGCRELDSGGQSHDEGAWVLASTNKALPNNPQELLDQFREAVTNISATSSDFSINDFSSEHSCSCPTCSYSMNCPADEDPPVYDYYDGINYSNYPQYNYNYDYTTEKPESYPNYPAYYSNSPTYYYYYDDNNNNDTKNINDNNLIEPAHTTTETNILDEKLTESSILQAASDLRTTENSYLTNTDFVTESGENYTQIFQDYQRNNNETVEIQ